MSVQQSMVPTAITVTLDIRAETPQAVMDALLASLMAMREGIEPNTLWAAGHYCVGIRTSGEAA